MKRVIVTIVLATTVAAFVAIAVSEASSTPARTSARRMSRPLRDTFSVLRSAKIAESSPESALPANMAEHLTEPGAEVSEYELEPERAVYVGLTPTDHGWLVPGRSGICLVLPSPSNPIYIGTTCASIKSAEADGLVSVERPTSGPPVAYGLVPNGASVTANDTDGSSAAVPVTGDMFLYGGETVRSVSIHLPNGSVKTRTLAGTS